MREAAATAQADAHGVGSWLWSKSLFKWKQLNPGHGTKIANANAKAGGSTFIIDGPPGEMAQVLARIPRTGTVADPTHTPGQDAPSQGMYCDSFFDNFLDVDVGIWQSGTLVELLNGSAQLSGPSALTTTGDLAASHFTVSDLISPFGEPRKQAILTEDIVSSIISVPTNTPFESVYDVALQDTDGPVTNTIATLGSAADFVVQLELVDRSGTFTLRAVPEPSTLALLGVGALGLLAFAWRRRKRTCRPG